MNNDSRIKNSIKNTFNGILAQFVSLGMSFLVRTIFLIFLNESYLGINGLFTNILTLLSLVELGFGPAMVYQMYKPLAEKDIPKIQALMNLYSRTYAIMGAIVAVLGVSVIPFMDNIIKHKTDVENLTLIYLIFLSNSVISYFFSYKRSILSADQKEYLNTQYRYIFSIVKSVLQILILAVTRNFILFITIQTILTVAENISISMRVNRIYPFLKGKNSQKLKKDELGQIVDDVKALILAKFGYVIINGSQNILIASLLGIILVGRLSNYTLITTSVVMIISQVASGLTASVGNYIALEDKEKQYNLFKTIDFAIFWIYGFSSICIVILINPFIYLWIGGNFLLQQEAVIVIGINLFIEGTLGLFWVFRSTMGLFGQGKYRPIAVAILNIGFSILLGKILGITGILLGITLARLTVNMWYEPLVIFKYGLGKNPIWYYKKYISRFTVLIILTISVHFIGRIVLADGITIPKFILLMVVCLIVPNTIFFLIYYKSDEFRYLARIAQPLIKNIGFISRILQKELIIDEYTQKK